MLAAFAGAVAGGMSAGRLLFGSRLPRQPEDVVVFLAAVTLCVLLGWFIVNVVSWTVALRSGQTLRRFTLPGTRRLAQALVALSLSTSCLVEADDSPSMVLIESEVVPAAAEPLTTLTPTSTTLSTTTASSTTTLPTTTALPVELAPEPTTTTTEVEPASGLVAGDEIGSILAHDVIVNHGDNLWSLSVETLERHGVADPSVSTIASYWRLVIDANDVRSGNPNVIVAGEAIHMPAQSSAGTALSPHSQAIAVR